MSRPRYNWECPTCHVPAGQHCRSLKTVRVTDTHQARLGWVGILNDAAEQDDPPF